MTAGAPATARVAARLLKGRVGSYGFVSSGSVYEWGSHVDEQSPLVLFELEHGAAWPVYCGRVESQRLGGDLPEGRVPATFLVAEAEGQIIGRVSIRHELNAYLTEVGGHIGYGVRPGFRRRGYATAIMRQSLAVALSLGLERCW